MRSIYVHIIWLITVLWSFGCTEPVNLDVPVRAENIVVYGWITDENRPYEVVLSKTNGFNDRSPYEAVSGALVYVEDRIGTRYEFVESGNTGVYLSNPNLFVGIPGNSYTLHINTVDGLEIISTSEELRPLPELSTVILEPALPQVQNVNNDLLYVAALIDDEVDRNNYYRWKIFVNDVLQNSPDDLVLFDDQFTDGNLFKFDASNVLFTASDNVYLKHMSLSERVYTYYTQLKDLTDANAIGTISQFYGLNSNLKEQSTDVEILGIFGTSSIQLVPVQSVP